MKRIYLFMLFNLLYMIVFSQAKINPNDIGFDKTVYIFNGTPPITKCDLLGNPVANDQYANVKAPANATFLVHSYDAAHTLYIIYFQKWKINNRSINIQNSLIYNKFVPSTDFTADKGSVKSFMATPTDNLRNNVKKNVNTFSDEVYFTISKSDLENYAFVYEPVPKVTFTYGTVSYLARLRKEVRLILFQEDGLQI